MRNLTTPLMFVMLYLAAAYMTGDWTWWRAVWDMAGGITVGDLK